LTAGELTINDSIEAAVGGGHVFADKQLVVTRTMEPWGLLFSGEVDISNSHAVADCIGMTFLGDQDVHLDVSELIFCDISGIRSFVDAAQNLDEGRLMIHGLPPLLQKVMRVTGWADLPRLVLCSCQSAKA
jgi:anti-anti-sigma factor